MKKTLQVLGIIAVAAMMGLSFTACQDPEPPPAPVISITTQPVPEVNVTAGSITGTLFVAASVTQNAAPSFQWFRNTTASNVGGTIIPGATGLTFTIPANPTNLAARTYFFFVEVRANGAEPIRSRVARVNVTAASATVTAVTVSPSTASVARGQSRQFTATVSGTNNPAQTVNWSVTGSNNSGTNINLNSGLLTVAGDETATSLTVTATSTVDTNRSGTAVVTVAAPTVTSVTVSPSTASVVRGRTEQFTAAVIGTGNPAQTVTWSLTGSNIGVGTSIDATSGLLTVAIDQPPTTLTVRATSTVDTNRSGTATVTVPSAIVSGVTVSPSTASVARGQTRQFTATVSGTGHPAQTVTWSVTGGGNGTSIDTDGLLTVDENESATSLTVTARSTVDTNRSGAATVTVPSATVTDVEVSPSTADIIRGQTQQFSATVSGTGNPAQTVTWEVIGGGTGTSINANGLLTVAIDQTPATLTVTATSTVDTNRSGTASVTVPQPTVTSVEVSPLTAYVIRGQTRQFTATVSGTNNPDQTVNWSVSGGRTGTNISASGLLTVAANESATSLTVTATSTADTSVSVTASVTVPAPTVTSVEVNPSIANVIRGQTQQFTATVSGTNNPDQTVNWSVSGGGTGTNISASGLLTVAADQTPATLTVTATSTTDMSVSGTANVTIVFPPSITTTTLSLGSRGREYSQKLEFTGTTPTWDIASGTLPPGLNLSSSGVISGTPTTEGTFSFTVRASNIAGNFMRSFSITIHMPWTAVPSGTGNSPSDPNWVPGQSTFGAGGISDIAYGIVHGTGRFVAVGANGRMAWSNDGMSWTAVLDSTFGAGRISGIAYGNGRFVAVGSNGRMAWSDWP